MIYTTVLIDGRHCKMVHPQSHCKISPGKRRPWNRIPCQQHRKITLEGPVWHEGKQRAYTQNTKRWSGATHRWPLHLLKHHPLAPAGEEKQNVNPPVRSERLRRLRDPYSRFLQPTDRRVPLLKKLECRESFSCYGTVRVSAREPGQTRWSNGGVVIQAVAGRRRGSEIAEAGKRDMSQFCG